MGFWERRRHIKEAKDLLRVGAQVEDLHEALKVVAKQGEQWHQFVPHGGWRCCPASSTRSSPPKTMYGLFIFRLKVFK